MTKDQNREIDPSHKSVLPPVDNFTASLGGFGVAGIIAILAIIFTGNIPLGNFILPVGALLVLVWVKISRTPWADIGYSKPKNIFLTITGGILLGIVLKCIMKAIVMPMLGADPVNQAYHYLSGDKAMIPAALWAMLVAGFGEETVFRGFMFERLRKLIGWNIFTKIFIVLFTAIWFGLAHFQSQGVQGVEQAFILGMIWGTIYAKTNRIWLAMVTHAAFDLTAYAMIYWNLETSVAHFLLK